MPSGSDSNYVAVTRHRRPFSRANARPIPLLVDPSKAAEEWSSQLEPDDVLLSSEMMTGSAGGSGVPMSFLFEDGEDRDAIVVVTRSNQEERRRKEQGWNDLGLELILDHHNTSSITAAAVASTTSTRQRTENNNTSTTSTT